MWMFFEDGSFYSAVVDRENEEMFWVRSRDKNSADNLAGFVDGEVVELEKRDYAYRVHVTREEWDLFVVQKIYTAQATNFKSEVGRNTGWNSPIMDALHDIWSVMFRYQTDEETGTRKRF